MAQPVDGLYLNKYVDPQLLIETSQLQGGLHASFRLCSCRSFGCGRCTQKQN